MQKNLVTLFFLAHFKLNAVISEKSQVLSQMVTICGIHTLVM